MKTLVLCLLLLTLPSHLIASLFTVRVIDGDSIAAELKGVDPKITKVIVRVYGIDTPESGARAKCIEERVLAENAKVFTKNMVEKASLLQYDIIGWDKYGGRILANVYVDGRSLSEALVSRGLARAYFGEKKKSWCSK